MPNRLANEPSRYLQQHKDNPVDWYPWGPEALALAAREEKPLLVSVGYSACHWCHVMAHESFENDKIAALMNRHFVCIKIDREERPDLDAIFMEAVQMMHGQGGWPLNVFCLPDGRPFAGGTYFPPRDNGMGRVPWPQLLVRVSDYFTRERKSLEENAHAITSNLTVASQPPGGGGELASRQILLDAGQKIADEHDDDHGGFGAAPKFPPAMALGFLLDLIGTQALQNDHDRAKRLAYVVRRTLDAMARGGLYDHLAGGFARYCVDASWTVPHFEKMLYDNALLLDIYARAYRRFADPLYAAVIRETIGWLQREMLQPSAGIAATIDADSIEGEGTYYVWNPSQVAEILPPEEAFRFCQAYQITQAGNFEHGNTVLALRPEITPPQREALAPLREKLLAARTQRPAPGIDTKRLTSWTGLLLRGLAESALALQEPSWIALARDLAEELWTHHRREDGRLYAVRYDEGPRHEGTLDDYAHLAEGFLALAAVIDLLEDDPSKPPPSTLWIERATTLAETAWELFGDVTAPGLFHTSEDITDIPQRRKDWSDNAIPAGNSSLLHVSAQLFTLTGDNRWQERHTELRQAYGRLAEEGPQAIPHALASIVQEAVGIAVVKAHGLPLKPLAQQLSTRPARRTFLLRAAPTDKPHYLVCVGPQCQPPISTAEEAASLL